MQVEQGQLRRFKPTDGELWVMNNSEVINEAG